MLDLELVELIVSNGLGAIVSAFKKPTPKIKLDLFSPGEIVNTVLKLGRMTAIFAIYDDVHMR